jgi:hypothetical protein
MKHLFILSVFAAMIACKEPNKSGDVKADSIPTLKPDTLDTSRVVTTPPTGDSNVVYPDSSVKNK